MLSMLPQLLPTQLPMLLLLMTLLSNLPTPSPTLLLMTTPSPASMLRNHLMELPMLLDPTLLLFLMAESNTSSTPPMDMMDSLLMSPMREPLSTQRRWLPQPQLTMLKRLIKDIKPRRHLFDKIDLFLLQNISVLHKHSHGKTVRKYQTKTSNPEDIFLTKS